MKPYTYSVCSPFQYMSVTVKIHQTFENLQRDSARFSIRTIIYVSRGCTGGSTVVLLGKDGGKYEKTDIRNTFVSVQTTHGPPPTWWLSPYRKQKLRRGQGAWLGSNSSGRSRSGHYVSSGSLCIWFRSQDCWLLLSKTPYLIGPFPFLGYIFNDVQSCFKGPSSKSKTRHTHTDHASTSQFPRCLQMSYEFCISHHHFDHGITIDLSGGLPLPNGWDNQSIPRKVPDRHGNHTRFYAFS